MLISKSISFFLVFYYQAYYYFDEKDYVYNHYNNREEELDREKTLPFNSKNISTKRVYDYIFKSRDPRKNRLSNILQFFVMFNIVFFFISYKFKKYSKHHLDAVMKLSNE